jgi:hypothetical protein
MKKILLLLAVGIFIFTACQKEETAIVNKEVTKQTVVPSKTNIEGSVDALTITEEKHFFHNGLEISGTSLDLTNDNISVVTGFAPNPSAYIVFFNDTEVNQWLAKQPESSEKSTYIKAREFIKGARVIAQNTKAEAYADSHDGELPADYVSQATVLHQRIFGTIGTPRALGSYYDNPDWTGAELWIVGLLGWPVLPAYIDKKISSGQVVTAIGIFLFTKRFYFGSMLYVNPAFGTNVGNIPGGLKGVGFTLLGTKFDNAIRSTLHCSIF